MNAGPALRDERRGDEPQIAALVGRAFEGHPHSAGTEAAIIARLRADDALVLSLVAEDRPGSIVGHVAFSVAMIDGVPSHWHTLGPLAVVFERRRAGIGGLLVRAGLERLRARGSQGALLVGDPAYYGRFGFVAATGLDIEEPLRPYLQIHPFAAETPRGRLGFHPAFEG